MSDLRSWHNNLPNICIDCDGDGKYPSGATCISCDGSGRVTRGDGIPDTRPVYSFDDNHFGITQNGNQTITTRLVTRPASLPKDEWYKFAGELVRVLPVPPRTL